MNSPDKKRTELADLEVLYFRSFSCHDGHVEEAQLYRRNGQLMVQFPPESTMSSLEQPPHGGELDPELVDEVCENLTEVERRTWLAIIDRRSIPDIARDEGVSHAAIYERIRGRKGAGGMIAKNRYVSRWWELRQQRKKQT